jgi:hypothetical protein
MAGLQKLVENLQAEINNLRSQVSSGRVTVPKDFSYFTYTQVVWDRKVS